MTYSSAAQHRVVRGPCCAAWRWCQPLVMLQVASIAAAVKPGSKSGASAVQPAQAPRGRASAPVVVSRRQKSGSPSRAHKQDKGAPPAKGPPPGKGSEAQQQQKVPLTAEQEAERFMEQFVAYASPQGVPAPGEHMAHSAPGMRNNVSCCARQTHRGVWCACTSPGEQSACHGDCCDHEAESVIQLIVPSASLQCARAIVEHVTRSAAGLR